MAGMFGCLQLQKTSQFCSCLSGLGSSYELRECYLRNADSLIAISNSLSEPLESEGRTHSGKENT